MIKKKIGKITFGWDPTAYKGKGWWYVVGLNDSFARAASRGEAQKLGSRPKSSEESPKDVEKQKYYYTTNPKTNKPQRHRFRTGSGYEEADVVRSKGLMQLASERMLNKEGLGKSLAGAIGDKIHAKGVGIKRMFDPMNMLSKIPGIGKLAATAYGMKRKRDPSDISYFTGIQAPPRDDKEEMQPTRERRNSKSSSKIPESTQSPKQSLFSRIFGQKQTTEPSSRGAAAAVKQLYKLMSDKFEEDKKIKEIEDSFKEEQKAEADERYESDKKDTGTRHKELINAITKGMKPKEKKEGIFDFIAKNFKSILGTLGGLLSTFGTGLLSILSPLAGILAPLGLVVGGVIAGSKLIDKGYEAITGKSSDSYNKSYDEKTTPEDMKKFMDKRKLSGVSDEVRVKSMEADKEQLKRTGKIVNKFTGQDVTKQRTAEMAEFEKYQQFKKTDPYQQYKTEVELKDYKGKKRPTFEEWKTQKGIAPKSVGQTATKVPDTVNPQTEEQIYKKLSNEYGADAMKDPKFVQSVKEEAHMQATQTTATPQQTPPSSLGPRATAATKENQNLAGPSAKSSAPVIVNKTTNVVNNGGVSGGSGGGGRVRNDEAVLTRLQFQNVRPV
jgi:hypothetical protein